MSKLTTGEFIAKSMEKHGDTYDYMKTVYTGTNNKLIITCKLHGDFSITANSHLNGRGCYQCGLIKRAKSHRLINEKIEAVTSTKVCSSCKIDKPINDFSPNKKLLHGVANTCKSCNNSRLIRKRLLKRPLPMFVTHKRCNKCSECLPVRNFGSEKAKRLSSVCMKCMTKYTQLPENISRVKEIKKKDKLKHASRYKEMRVDRDRSPATSKLFISKMIKEDKPEDRDGLLFISCKKCGLMFNPTIIQVYSRIQGITKPDGRDNNFYCSENCKETCDVFRRITRRKSEKPNTKARSCQTTTKKTLISMQCDETGYNYCEKCGEVMSIELHHTQMVQDKENENNPAGHLLLCYKCHKELHSECR